MNVAQQTAAEIVFVNGLNANLLLMYNCMTAICTSSLQRLASSSFVDGILYIGIDFRTRLSRRHSCSSGSSGCQAALRHIATRRIWITGVLVPGGASSRGELYHICERDLYQPGDEGITLGNDPEKVLKHVVCIELFSCEFQTQTE
jgi:hypothetical protein